MFSSCKTNQENIEQNVIPLSSSFNSLGSHLCGCRPPKLRKKKAIVLGNMDFDSSPSYKVKKSFISACDIIKDTMVYPY